MAMSFTSSVPYTYWKVIISFGASICILFLTIIHVYGYVKYGRLHQHTSAYKFKEKYFNSYSIVNFVTILTLIIYDINSWIIFLSKFNLIIDVISCKVYNDIMGGNWQIANFCKLSVFILRLNMAFSGSQYAYNKKYLLLFGAILFLQSIVNVTLHSLYQYGDKYVIQNLFYACKYNVPFYILATGNLTDLII